MSDTTPPTTPSQTVGPYLHIGLHWPDGPFAVAEGTPEGFWIRGTLTDGAGQPISDGLIETWQADPNGRFDHPDDPRGPTGYPGFRAFGRCDTDEHGEYGIFTLAPGAVPGPGDTLQAPHIDVSVFARGMLHRTVTRIYFPENVNANAADPVLSTVADETARSTLVAEPATDGYRFDIRLQGENETVFFEI
ncbi:protocatechuate 3,4-dioxygenase alpha subunit [Lipingzhangella halophila]|uniref:Protocatechuate 3,4-dioxygenase alpha subunit n=1 Tax=Lipingzhangella halophila TaxID=1783352 RepID=A0A7W7W187_9ACTN|nr:protocatechuate 3,4-dioxygenase subunit alpha [Lipingzhangella halophila]MBB4930391.1 protocatechuate 3,4-dioxygenase alpha subunit [Lipingzhangella halophila]